MRIESRFKTFLKSKAIIFSCPNKILKFNHTKWTNLKRNLKKKLTRRFFFNYSLNSSKIKKWSRKRFLFKNRLLIRRQFNQKLDTVFDKKFSIKNAKFKKKPLFLDSFLTNSILKFEFVICILLFRLNFYSSIHEAKNKIMQAEVLVNNKPVLYTHFLKVGDVITFNSSFDFLKILKTNIKISTYLPFIEIDYYTNTVIIIKNLKNLTVSDVSLITPNHTNLSKVYWALQKN
jgi:ribosomal protein S4